MRVLQIGHSYINDAQGMITRSIESEMNAQGIKYLTLFTERNTVNSSKNRKRCNFWFTDILTRGLNRIFGREPWHASMQTMFAIYHIMRFKPDIIQMHVIHHTCFNFQLLFRFLINEKYQIVYTLHDMWILTGGCYHYSDVKCSGYINKCIDCKKTKGIDCSQKKAHHYFKEKRNFIKKTHISFIAVSDWVKDNALQVLKASKLNVNVKTIRNGIDTSIFYPSLEKKKNNDAFVIIGVASSWSDSKGIYKFFELANMLDDKYIIKLVGSTKEIDISGAPSNIVFLGKLDNKEKLADEYRNSDVFVHLSSCETFGMVFIEAAMCGLPVIGFDSTGISEVVKSVDGYLAPDGDVSFVRELVNTVCNSGWRNNEENINYYSNKFMASQYVEYYKSILNCEVRKEAKHDNQKSI